LLGFFLLKFFLLRLFEKSPKLKNPPNAERLMVAALAAKGLNSGLGFGRGFSIFANDLSERGTTPSLPWKTQNAVSKLGPSWKIGPLAPLTGTGKLVDDKEKLVGSLMLLRMGIFQFHAEQQVHRELFGKWDPYEYRQQLNLHEGGNVSRV
jgi:hypothetical protein